MAWSEAARAAAAIARKAHYAKWGVNPPERAQNAFQQTLKAIKQKHGYIDHYGKVVIPRQTPKYGRKGFGSFNKFGNFA